MVNTPGDRHEQEADRVAEQVMRMSDPAAHPGVRDLAARHGPALQRACAACEEEKEDEQLQRKESGGEPGMAVGGGSAPAIVDDVIRSSGGPLDRETRSFMEPRFGADFGGVRVHTDDRAAESAAAVSARAYTVGRSVVFGRGEYRPGTDEGRRLLAHELAHVVQQRGAPAGMLQRRVVPASDPGGQPVPYGERPQEPIGPVAPPPAGPAPTPRPESCVPPPMDCIPGYVDPTDVLHSIRFSQGSATLDSTQKAGIDALLATLRSGRFSRLRIDGYASAEGECRYNWDLSCRRAQAILDELTAPSDGSEGRYRPSIDVYAHGESDAAGRALAPNRNGLISLTTRRPPSPFPRWPGGFDPWEKPWGEPEPAPPTPAPPTPVPTCTMPVRLGRGARGSSCAAGPDFTHHDFPSISGTSEAKLRAWALTHGSLSRAGVSDAACETEMHRVLSLLAGGAGTAAVARFIAGTGGTVTHGISSTLGFLALRSGSFRATLALVKADIEAQLAAMAALGKLDPCLLRVTVPQTNFGPFDGLTLKSVIGGTQGEELFATGFGGSIASRVYSIDLRFVICDDFGVDESDLYAPGLMPFWVLQHERSATAYAPFVNELDLPVTLSGTF